MIPTGGVRHSTMASDAVDPPPVIHAVVVLTCGTVEAVTWPVVSRHPPDLDMVDRLARLRLDALRTGCDLRLRQTSRDLAALLDLAGLTDVLTERSETIDTTAASVEMGGETEGREQPGVEEVVVPDDPVT